MGRRGGRGAQEAIAVACAAAIVAIWAVLCIASGLEAIAR